MKFVWNISFIFLTVAIFAQDPQDEYQEETTEYEYSIPKKPLCERDKNSQFVQVMFLFGRSSSYLKYAELFKDILGHNIIFMLDNVHFATIAVSSFGNWDDNSARDSCYKNEVSMVESNHDQLLRNRLEHFNPSAEKDDLNSLAALAFAAKDRNAQWHFKHRVDGVEIRRFIALLTDVDNTMPLLSSGKRKDFAGDGTDTCDGSLSPSYSTIRRILRKHRFNVIGFYSNQTLLEKYANHFYSLGTPYCAGHFRDDQEKYGVYLKKTIDRCVRKILKCLRTGKDTITEKWQDQDNYDYSNYDYDLKITHERRVNSNRGSQSQYSFSNKPKENKERGWGTEQGFESGKSEKPKGFRNFMFGGNIHGGNMAQTRSRSNPTGLYGWIRKVLSYII